MRSNRQKPFLSANVCWGAVQLNMSVVLGEEAIIRVEKVQGSLVVAHEGLLPLLWAVVQRVGVNLLDVPLDGADF